MRNLHCLVTGTHDNLPKSLDDGSLLIWRMVDVLECERILLQPSQLSIVLAKPYDWVIFTSRNAVRFWTKLLLDLDGEFPFETQVACIGETTARASEAIGFSPDFYPTESGSEGFLREFEDLMSNNTLKPSVLIPGAKDGRALIAQRLSELGCEVQSLAIYQTKAKDTLPIEQAELDGQDVVLFTSPSSVDAILAQRRLTEKTRVLSLGRFTSRHLTSLGIFHRIVPAGDLGRIGEVL